MFTFSLDGDVCLRLLEEGDAAELYDVIAANRHLLTRWLPWAARQTLEGTATFISASRRQWGSEHLEIRAGTENVRSQRVPERLGFTREGVVREVERIGDRYLDHVIYSTLARDWNR